MYLRTLALAAILGVPISGFASIVNQGLVGSDPNLRALNLTTLVPLHNGLFIAGGASVSNPAEIRGVILGQFGPAGAHSFMALDQNTEVGSSAFLHGDTWVFMTSMHGSSGVGNLSTINRNSGFGSSMTSVWNAAGPAHPVPGGVSIDGSRNVNALFEVRPASLAPRISVVVTLPMGQFSAKQVHTYSLAAGEQILDCAPRPDGGLVYLSGTPTSASVNVINADGTRNGPFFVGAATEIAYSPTNGGTIFTAGKTGAKAFFTRGPISGAFTDSNLQIFPFTNFGFEFDASCTMSDGTCWWGGSFKNASANQDGFIAGVENNASLTFFGASSTPSTSSDEGVRDISLDPYGRGIWAGDGQFGLFNATTGQSIQVHPASPSATLRYKAVVNAPFSSTSTTPYSNFGVIGFDTVAQRSVFAVVSRNGDLLKASTPLTAYVGGTSPTLTVQLYRPMESAGISYPAISSNSAVTVPASFAFGANDKTKSVSLTTLPVATAQDIVITVGSTDSVLARFTLLPPTPKLFAPVSQSVKGGQSIVSRLTLSGKTPAAGLTVALSDNGSELSTDSTMSIPGGLYSKSFLIRTTPVSSPVTRMITATYAGVSRTTDITITP